MVLFGEVLLPISRVILDDEEEVQQITRSTLNWKGNADIPNEVDTLLIVETEKLVNLAKTCLEENIEPRCSLPIQMIQVFKLKANNYMILCGPSAEDIITGEITEKLAPWFEKCNRIVCLTSAAIVDYQTYTRDELPPSFIRTLYTGDVGKVFAPRLKLPNLLTGITAGVLAYCQHVGKSAALYVCYTDSRPLDSTTAKPILDLISKLNIQTHKPFEFKPVFRDDSNLYI